MTNEIFTTTATSTATTHSTSTAPTLEKWNNDYHSSLTIKTRDLANRTVKNNVAKYIGTKPLDQITANDISKVYASLKIKGMSDSTLVVTDTYLNRLLKAAVAKGYIAQNPLDTVDRPVSLPKDICPYTEAEQERITTAIKASPLSTLFVLVGEQGMRSCEALALTWDDVDFKQNVIRVHQTYTNINTQPTFHDVSEKGIIFTMEPVAASALKEEKRKQEKKIQLAADRWNNKRNLVFTNAFGYPLQHQYVMAECKNMKNRTHLADFSLNRLASDYAFKHKNA